MIISWSQVHWDNRCEALQAELSNSRDGGSLGWKLIQTALCIKIASIEKKGWVMVMGNLEKKTFYHDTAPRSLSITHLWGRQKSQQEIYGQSRDFKAQG